MMHWQDADSIFEVRLQALQQNYLMLQGRASTADCAAVVKADAYGLGVGPVSKALADVGCASFFVAHVEEGIELRSVLPDVTIFVFHGVAERQVSLCVEHRLVPVLNSLEQVGLWRSVDAPAALHVDTGMERLGVPFDQVERVEGDFVCVMSHLACADTPEHALNQLQLERCLMLRERFAGIPLSVANSAGIFLGEAYHFDMVRPGCALYGVNPVLGMHMMQPVVRLVSHIVQVRSVEAGASVGYGGDAVSEEDRRIAVVPVGYADGYLRALSGKGLVSIGGVTVPIVGRVSMDLITVDVTGLDAGLQQAGQEVELLGEHVLVDDVAHLAGTIGYEVLTGLGKGRFSKVYI